eukprot:TRINITY_DN51175_c0_g1_i1.p1 TRINITY_DN51175_c0_g1~~TRINITY_DN51175_c0_g1_i1.p1  ORF type:complete len:250 (-),score=39.66 TRINITY_DN51175_c0_g1_i1:175-924(-)
MYRDALIRNTYQAMVVYDGDSTTLTVDHPAYHDFDHNDLRRRDAPKQGAGASGGGEEAGDAQQEASPSQQKKHQPYRPPKGGYSLESVAHSHAEQRSGLGEDTSSAGQSCRDNKRLVKFHTTFTTSNNVLSTPTAQLQFNGFPASNRSLTTMTPMSGACMSDGTQVRQFTTTPLSFDDNNSFHNSLNFTFTLPPSNIYDDDTESDNSWLEDDNHTTSTQFDDLIAEAVQRNIDRSKGCLLYTSPSPRDS